MDESCLEKVVDRDYLIGNGFKEKGTKFIAVKNKYVVCYYPIANGMYAVHFAERVERHVLGREED